MGKNKKITSMSNSQVEKYLLKGESYCNLDLPIYFEFDNILNDIKTQVAGRDMDSLYDSSIKPWNLDDVNYKMINNKDGNLAWRPFEIIHPFLYLELVELISLENNWKEIKNRFKEYSKLKTIKCCSIPIESKSKKTDKKEMILTWWNEFEQETISKSIDFKYMSCTDITNCYSSIYTHSIPWALHTKNIAKIQKNNKNLLGNIIDKKIQNMQFGQTNGIPQGSVLMDFIAELILGYADELLYKELDKNNIVNYYILRYRDDYRIFSNNSAELQTILKIMTETLSILNFKLNPQKTITTDDIITNSLKKDKLFCFENPIDKSLNLQKKILVIRGIGNKFPNSGSIQKLLTELYKKVIKKIKHKPNNIEQLISIIVDIMYNSPRTFPICSAILSKLLSFLSSTKRNYYIKKIKFKFQSMPNTDYLNIWLQRITIPIKRRIKYENTLLCKKIYDNSNIWNSTWINSINIDEGLIINEDVIDNLKYVIAIEEVDIFNSYDY